MTQSSGPEGMAGQDIWALPLVGGGQPARVTRTPFTETSARFSPDGRWVAYQSDEFGLFEVYVQPFPTGGRKIQISRDGATSPRWRGDELFYVSGTRLMVVTIHTTPALDVGQPKLLHDFQGRRYSGFTPIAGAFGLGSTFDVSPDGSRILAIKEPEPETTVDLVINWFEELKRLAPTK